MYHSMRLSTFVDGNYDDGIWISSNDRQGDITYATNCFIWCISKLFQLDSLS